MKVYGKFFLITFGWGILFSLYGAMTCTDKYNMQNLVIAIAFGYLGACNRITVVVLLEEMVPYYLYIVLFSVLFLMWGDINHLNTTEIMKLRLNYSSHLMFSWHKWDNTELVKMDELKAHLTFGGSF